MSGQQRAFFDALPEHFTTAEAEASAEAVGASRATAFRWLDGFDTVVEAA